MTKDHPSRRCSRYNLTGNQSGICPEFGTPIENENREKQITSQSSIV